MARSAFHIGVLSVSDGFLPTAAAISPLRPKPSAAIRYKQKDDGTSTLIKLGWRFTVLRLAAAMIRQPSARQTRDVELVARFNSHSVIAMNAIFNKRMRLVRLSLRSGHRVNVSQKKNIPLIMHAAPSEFLPVVAPPYIAVPVHSLNQTLRCG